MVKNSIVALVGAGMLVAIAALWLRVRELEQSVDSLTVQLQSREKVRTIPIQMPAPIDESKKKQIFRLIDSHEYNEPVTGPFPETVDRAMMSDGISAPTDRIENNDQSTWQIEVTPETTIDIPDSNPSLDSIHLHRNAD